MAQKELADKYCGSQTSACTAFEEGQEFVLDDLNQPPDFCSWAWTDITKVLLTLNKEGNFKPWMKADNNIIACCTDGIRPVIFNIERVED